MNAIKSETNSNKPSVIKQTPLRYVKTKTVEAKIPKKIQNKKLCRSNKSNEKVFNSSEYNKNAYEIRLAVYEGGSTDPKTNAQLMVAIQTAADKKLPQTFIGQTIRSCEQAENDFNTYLLQMHFQHKIFLVCPVHTLSLVYLQRQLGSFLKRHNAGLAYSLPKFRGCGIIEALIPHKVKGDFCDLEDNLERVALECKARGIEKFNYEDGSVNFKCDAIRVPDVCNALQARCYKLLSTKYRFCPKARVDLDCRDRNAYENFLDRLRKIPEIQHIYDNLRQKQGQK